MLRLVCIMQWPFSAIVHYLLSLLLILCKVTCIKQPSLTIQSCVWVKCVVGVVLSPKCWSTNCSLLDLVWTVAFQYWTLSRTTVKPFCDSCSYLIIIATTRGHSPSCSNICKVQTNHHTKSLKNCILPIVIKLPVSQSNSHLCICSQLIVHTIFRVTSKRSR